MFQRLWEIAEHFFEWVVSVCKEWAAWVTGGIITAADYAVHAWRDTKVTHTELAILTSTFLLFAFFNSWRKERLNLQNAFATHAAEINAEKSKGDFERKRKHVSDCIGQFMENLNGIRVQIYNLKAYNYTAEKHTEFSAAIGRLTGEIQNFLASEIGGAAVFKFTNLQNMKRPQIDYQGALSPDRHKEWQETQHKLNHWIEQLGQIEVDWAATHR